MEWKRRIKERYNNYMRKHALGLYTFLNFVAKQSTGVEFIELLLERPSAAYRIIVAAYGDSITARLVLTIVLRSITDHLSEIDRAITALERGSDEDFLEILESIASLI